MNEKIDVDPKGVAKESQSDRQRTAELDGLAIRQKIITTCVGIEFLAMVAAFSGVTPNVFFLAIGASTISAIFAFILAWKVSPFAGTALAALNALTCFRLWSVPWLISDGGLSKYLLIVIVSMRVIGWIALLIINRRARMFFESSVSNGGGGTY